MKVLHAVCNSCVLHMSHVIVGLEHKSLDFFYLVRISSLCALSTEVVNYTPNDLQSIDRKVLTHRIME